MEVEIYIHLLDESASRPTQAIVLGNNVYKVLPTSNYNSADEDWEFIPGSLVRCEEREYNGRKYLQAIEVVN